VNKDEANMLIKEIHPRHYGDHFVARTTAHNILRVGYYWSTLFNDTHKYVRSCLPCKLFSWKPQLSALPLKPVIIEAPFQEWGLNFIGRFKDNSNNGYHWVLNAIDYFTM
jgi:hypothetical protein